ncbi:hypothetical protein CRE_23152 [Caenorhabditis remanei]|uniref:Uncharacterized protein n=1 Tax=Caenorhabditis remanei TaxID=31234 RepID=E3NFX3_CAERE|nr:hypothetical protein CRE_23152 [Caenorhabditis remanei]
MKIHMVVLYLYLLIIGANGEAKKKSGGRLTLEENKQRLRTCGTTGIDTPSSNSTSMEPNKFPDWLSWAITRNQNSGAALTTMISPRHFLTSSQVVMHDDKTWRWNSERVKECDKEKRQNSRNLEVPKEILEHLELFKTECPSTCKNTSVIPVTRAVILNYCLTNKLWQWSQAVMVMEIAEDIGVDNGFPCLEYDTQPNGEMLDVYSFLWKGKLDQHISHMKLPVLKYKAGKFYKFPRYNEDGERGSPVMRKKSTGNWTLVGLGAQNISDSETGVLRMSWIGWQLCREVGVCYDSTPPPPPPKPTAPPRVETTTMPTATKKAEPKKTKKPEPPPVNQVPITVKPITPATKPMQKPTVTAGKLTEAENERRLQTCGQKPIDTPSGNSTSVEIKKWPDWAWGARTHGQNGAGTALTTMISPRHFLTSSQVVMHDNTTWRWNSERVKKCKTGRVNLKVPREVLDNLVFKYLISRAVILDYCKMDERMWNATQGVMIMELKKDANESFPCLADSECTDYVMGFIFIVDNFLIAPPILIYLTGDHTKFLVFDRYHEDGQRGGQIMDNVNGRWTLVGLGAGGTSEKSVAFRISALQESLCEETGVCWLKDVPKLPPPQTTELIPKELSTTSSKTPEAPSPPPTSPPEPSPEAPPPRVAPPARRREDDETDEDYEMYLKRKKEKEEAEMYENEDTDILISKDFFDDGTRPQLWITLFIIAFLVFL